MVHNRNLRAKRNDKKRDRQDHILVCHFHSGRVVRIAVTEEAAKVLSDSVEVLAANDVSFYIRGKNPALVKAALAFRSLDAVFVRKRRFWDWLVY